MVKYPLTGGLDLITVKPLAKPGSLAACMNFEVSTTSGYTRIQGLARFDGSEEVGAYKVWRLKSAGPTEIVAGDTAYFDPELEGRVLDVAMQDGNAVIYLLVPGVHSAPQLPATLTGPTTNSEIVQREVVFKGYGTQDNFDAGLASIEANQRERIGQVPGREGSDIIGGFGYKDRAYVIRDLPRLAFQGGYYTDADEGKYVTVEGQEYKILDVTITGDQLGIITFDTEPGTGVDAAPIGDAVLTTLPVTGDYDPGYTFVPYSDDLDVTGGVPPYTWSLVGDEGVALPPVESPDANAINFLPQLTNAALYRSSPSGWQRVDLGREMQFRNGTVNLKNFLRSAVLTGSAILNTSFMPPGTGKINGVTTANLAADDGVEAALEAGDTNEIQAYNFDLSVIPDSAAIQGIEVIVERHSNVGNAARDHTVNLMGIEGGTNNKAQSTVWPATSATTTYGGSDDLWGSQHITAPALKQAEFGVRIICQKNDPDDDMVGGVDRVFVKVYYIERDSQIYIWDGATDVVMTLHHTQIVSGVQADSTAQGYMSVTAAVNAEKPRLVNAGDTINTAPMGGGVQLAVVAGRDRPIWLAGQAELDNNRARYEFERTNFYGQDEFESVYGVCGASPAFSFDGVRCIRIRSELPAYQDLPRHITRHGDMLVLGYFPGAVVFSKVGDPYELRGTAGASAVEVGDRLVGLVPLAGDALGIVCQSQTQVIRGTTPTSMIKLPISARRGGIEYTVVDMGRAVLCDGLGIFLADSPESFGAASRNYISQPVHPWLRPRLQATINSESSHQRPVMALNVRHKNQMRLFFWDGWVLTMTMNEPAEFTTQRYFSPGANEHTEPVPWVPRMAFSYIDSSGRERLFCSFYGGVKAGYVFEIDASRTFDGDPIPHYLIFNPLTIDSSAKEKRYDRFFLYGHGHVRSTMTYSRSINDGDSFSGVQGFTMGKGSKTAKLTQVAMRGVVDAPVEAMDISIKLEGSTTNEGEFTLQYIEHAADDRGDSRGRQGDK